MKQKVLSTAAVAGLFGVAALLGAMPGCTTKSVSGTFTGSAKGMGGDVTVTLTIDKNVITDVKADGPNETVGIGDKALEKVPASMVSGNAVTVDTVSGATVTSNAVIEAAKAALEKSGLKESDLATVSTNENVAKDVNETADVVVVGAGGAGMTAAIVASDAGKKVIIVESQDVAGGNSVRATGGMNATKTTYQDENTFDEAAGVEKTLKAAESYQDNADVKALTETVTKQWADYQANPTGYFDSVELMELDTMIGGHAKNDISLVKELAEKSAPAIDWLASIGANLTNVGQFGGAAVKRIHRPVNDEGKTISVGSYIVPILEKNTEDRNVEVMYNTTANKIIMTDGNATGIEATTKDGGKVTITAKSVVIATGGFGANNDMVVAQDHPELKGYITTNAAGAQGQGITMATADDVKAATVDMDQIQLHPTVHVSEDGSASLITEGLRGDGAILVNAEGKRFTDEVGARDVVSDAENNQTNGSAWLIVDQTMVDASAVIQGYIKKGFTVTGTDVASLAKEMNVDAEALSATIDTWNKAVEAKSDTEFGRTSFNHQLTGNLYALTVQPGIHHTMGGLKINTNTEVLNTEGNVIGGLFAAGEVTGGVHGANRLGGNAVADFVVFGRIAGTAAAEYAK